MHGVPPATRTTTGTGKDIGLEVHTATEGETDSTTKTVVAVRKKPDLIPAYGRHHRVLSPILTTKNGVPIVDFRRTSTDRSTENVEEEIPRLRLHHSNASEHAAPRLGVILIQIPTISPSVALRSSMVMTSIVVRRRKEVEVAFLIAGGRVEDRLDEGGTAAKTTPVGGILPGSDALGLLFVAVSLIIHVDDFTAPVLRMTSTTNHVIGRPLAILGGL
ncbi:hypothetical protein BJX96DRAFT_170559 [Aspergillus floccosus]